MTFSMVLGTILYLVIIERIIPYRTHWHPTPREWRRDGTYFVIVVMMGALAQASLGALAVLMAGVDNGLPLWLETILALLVSTLCGYWFHRIGHVHRWLWKVHGVHHVPNKVNVANNSVVHFIDTFGSNLASSIPLVLFGFSEQAVFLVTLFVILHGYGAHCNADLRLGWLNYLVCGPELHRLHHSKRLDEAGHYGVDITLWDHAFGSFTWQPSKEPEEVGVIEPEKFPPALAIMANALHPFRRTPAAPAALSTTERAPNQ